MAEPGRHISWCTGDHNDEGACSLTVADFDPGEESVIEVTGKPCGGGEADLRIDLTVYPGYIEDDSGDLPELRALVARATDAFRIALVESDCEHVNHPSAWHPEDDDED